MLYNHIVNHEASKLLVNNPSDRPVYISRRHKLGHLFDIAYDNCFFVDTHFLHDSTTFLLSLQSFSDLSIGSSLSLVDFLMETVLDNGIKIYGDMAAVKQIGTAISINLGVSGLCLDTSRAIDKSSVQTRLGI